jgi:hypothetical protein
MYNSAPDARGDLPKVTACDKLRSQPCDKLRSQPVTGT